jgi:hypothetical protein
MVKEFKMKMTRRSLIQKATGLSALLALAPQLVVAEEKRRARGGDSKAAAAGPLGYPLVDPAGNAGKAVNYVKVHADLKDAKLKTERQGMAWDQQNCANCSFYKDVGSKDGGKVGTCTIFANQLVVEKGWCSSWNKKA